MAAPESTIPQSAIKDAAHAAAVTTPDDPAARFEPVEKSEAAATASRPDPGSFVTPASSLNVSPMEGTFPRAPGEPDAEKADVSPVSDNSPIPASVPAPNQPATAHTDANAAPAPARTETTPAIGPAKGTDAEAAAALAPAEAASTAVPVTLLLTSGARHPFRLDPRYLAKRNVTAEGDDPLNISVYTMKELIWRDWRPEWEPRPASPSSIRLISFGRLLDDKASLKGLLSMLILAGDKCSLGFAPQIADSLPSSPMSST